MSDDTFKKNDSTRQQQSSLKLLDNNHLIFMNGLLPVDIGIYLFKDIIKVIFHQVLKFVDKTWYTIVWTVAPVVFNPKSTHFVNSSFTWLVHDIHRIYTTRIHEYINFDCIKSPPGQTNAVTFNFTKYPLELHKIQYFHTFQLAKWAVKQNHPDLVIWIGDNIWDWRKTSPLPKTHFKDGKFLLKLSNKHDHNRHLMPFYLACEMGNLDLAKRCLDYMGGKFCEEVTSHTKSFLRFLKSVIKLDDVELFKWLFDHYIKAIVDSPHDLISDQAFLILAVQVGSIKIFSYMLDTLDFAVGIGNIDLALRHNHVELAKLMAKRFEFNIKFTEYVAGPFWHTSYFTDCISDDHLETVQCFFTEFEKYTLESKYKDKGHASEKHKLDVRVEIGLMVLHHIIESISEPNPKVFEYLLNIAIDYTSESIVTAHLSKNIHSYSISCTTFFKRKMLFERLGLKEFLILPDELSTAILNDWSLDDIQYLIKHRLDDIPLIITPQHVHDAIYHSFRVNGEKYFSANTIVESEEIGEKHTKVAVYFIKNIKQDISHLGPFFGAIYGIPFTRPIFKALEECGYKFDEETKKLTK